MISQLIIILLILYAFVNYFVVQAQKEGGDLLGDIGWWFDKFVAAVAIIIAVIVFIVEDTRTRRKEDKDKRDRIRRSCDTLLREIRENRDRLIRVGFLYSYIKSRATVDYSDTIFDMYAFQSVIHSGLLTYFSRDDQARLTKLYNRFDIHNEYHRYMTHLSTEFSSFGRQERVASYRSEIEKHELFLTTIDEDIRQLSPVVEQDLETIRQNNVTDRPNS